MASPTHIAPAPALDKAKLERLLASFEGHSVSLVCRTHLDDAVVARVREAVIRLAGRELDLEVKVLPTMDAGAVLYVGDSGRVVLDSRTMWLSDVRRDIRERIEAGDLADHDAAFALLTRLLSESAPQGSAEELLDTGSVIRVGDGVVSVRGLRGVASQEIVEFEGGVLGIAFSLRTDSVGVVLLGPEDTVREDCDVQRTGRLLHVPAGTAALGRVLDALARPIDDGGPIVPEAWLPVERAAPGVTERQPVDTPLHTGIKVIDALVPIGRGQRELVIGERKIGKTTIGVDTILAQGADVACIYCAIGQKASTVRHVCSTLAAHGALEHTAVITALPSDPPALRYLAPYTACALGEYFRDVGRDALVVYDDLSKHAVTYREMSALLDRPVGREAYPGDIFYLHARLLERAARLADALGGGSLTAMPIVETLAGDISAFIPTNVISICDGQIVLDSAAFNEGRRPALDAGLSVSRVGGSAQTPAMKRIAGRLRIDLAQYEEMARFVKFGAEVDEATERQLTRGERARELLRQTEHTPLSLADELLVLLAAVNGLFDEVAMADLEALEHDLLVWARTEAPEIVRTLGEVEFDAEGEAALIESVRAFVATRTSGA